MLERLLHHPPRTSALVPLRLAVAAALLLGACAHNQGVRFPGLPTAKEGAAHFVVFNVGQADSLLVLSGGKSLLFDAGVTMAKAGRESYRGIAHRLEELTGARRLDYFVVSHYHQDHIGASGEGRRARQGNTGLFGLLEEENVTIDTIVDRGFVVVAGRKGPTQRAYERAVERWIAQGKIRRRRAVKRHDLIDLGQGMRVEILAASGNDRLLEVLRNEPRLFARFPPSENDYSIALKFTKGDFELYAAGDLSGEDITRSFGPKSRMSYNDIESGIAEDVGEIEVYKVTHHGSSHSSNPCFVSVVHPSVSIFSTGKNSYGHPDLRVYRALKATGPVFITGGADAQVYPVVRGDVLEDDIEVVVAADGKKYWVQGKPFQSKSEADEAARPGRVTRCVPPKKVRDPEKAEQEVEAGAGVD
jgi:beta-lactamase superfamily II metal-dependent hydrolase